MKLLFSGAVSIINSSFEHISSWGSLITDSDYVGLDDSIVNFGGLYPFYQSFFAKRYPLNNSTLDWMNTYNCTIININSLILRNWLHEFRSKLGMQLNI